MPRPPITVHQSKPLPPLRHYISRSVTITPDDMDLAVEEPPVYDPREPREQEFARWIAWSARKRMAELLGGIVDRKIRESQEQKT